MAAAVAPDSEVELALLLPPSALKRSSYLGGRSLAGDSDTVGPPECCNGNESMIGFSAFQIQCNPVNGSTSGPAKN